MAKLSIEEVNMILSRLDAGESASDLAHEYGVSRQYIYLAKSQRHGRTARKGRAQGNILSVTLRSGPSIFVGINGNVLELSEMDRTFFFRVADLLRSYEKQNPHE